MDAEQQRIKAVCVVLKKTKMLNHSASLRSSTRMHFSKRKAPLFNISNSHLVQAALLLLAPLPPISANHAQDPPLTMSQITFQIRMKVIMTNGVKRAMRRSCKVSQMPAPLTVLRLRLKKHQTPPNRRRRNPRRRLKARLHLSTLQPLQSFQQAHCSHPQFRTNQAPCFLQDPQRKNCQRHRWTQFSA